MITLSGINGFKINGESPGDSISISSANVNGDSYADLLLGAPGYNNSIGQSYVVFGADDNMVEQLKSEKKWRLKI